MNPPKFWNNKIVTPSGCWEWQGQSTRNRPRVAIGKGRQRKLHYVYRYAWILTYGDIPDGLVICHKCDNPRCFNPEHLFMGTHGDNVNDKVQKSRQLRGESHHAAELTELIVKKILQDPRTQREIAKEYGISQPRVSQIKGGKRWKHVKLSHNTPHS